MGYVAAEDEETRTRTLVGPEQQEAEARKARIGTARAQARNKAGDEAHHTSLHLGASATAAEADRRFKELMYPPPGCVIHKIGDGHEEEVKRAEERLLSRRPAPPWRRPDGRATFWDWYILPLPKKFPRPHPDEPIPVGEPLDMLQHERLREERRRATTPTHFEQLAIDRELVEDCLRHYNSARPGDEYVPASGRVTRSYRFDDGACWMHGNFVARRRRSACCGGFFSFLPLPAPRRTLFFFERVFRGEDPPDGRVVTCTPLLDEPVTEAYSVLGFYLWWSRRRSGSLDCVCKTCRRRLDVTHPDLMRTFACGHREVERVCKMCYLRSHVLHPPPGEFAFGYHDRKRT
ncbi:hypothetical protein EJB05_38904, partial [Eragrostis curvula]